MSATFTDLLLKTRPYLRSESFSLTRPRSPTHSWPMALFRGRPYMLTEDSGGPALWPIPDEASVIRAFSGLDRTLRITLLVPSDLRWVEQAALKQRGAALGLCPLLGDCRSSGALVHEYQGDPDRR